MNSSTTIRHNAAARLPNRSKISVAPQTAKRTTHRHLTNRKTEKAAIVPQKTVPLDLEPKKILLNNNTAKIKNSNPTILSAGSISKPSLRKDAVIFAPIEKSTLGTTQSTRRIGKTKKSFAFISAFCRKTTSQQRASIPASNPNCIRFIRKSMLTPTIRPDIYFRRGLYL